MNLKFNKNNFNIEKIISELRNFCNQKNIDDNELLKMQLVSEEFLSNIIFPSFEDEVQMSILQKDNDTVLSFEYSGIDYMNKINETTILSLKILENKTKEIISNTENNKTIVSFII